MSYTPLNLIASYEPPLVTGSGSTNTTYSYDPDATLTQLLRPDSQTIAYGYDAAGRRSTITFSGGLVTYGYNPNTGTLSSISGPLGQTLNFTFDGPLLTDLTYGGVLPGALHWAFDNQFRVTSESVNGSFTSNFAYDSDGFMTQAGSMTLARTAQNGLLSGTTLGNVTDSYTYNAHGEVTGYEAKYQAATIFSEQYTRDLIRRIATRTETSQGVTHNFGYIYNPRGRLSDVTMDGSPAAHFDYDANGNRLARSVSATQVAGTYDNQDRILTYGDNVYVHGPNGELVSKTNVPAGQTTQYTHDALGSLTRVVLPDGTTIDYVTDGRGRRVGRKVNGILSQGFLYSNGLRLVAETDGAGNVLNRFVYTTRRNVPDYMIREGRMYRMLADNLGSIRMVADVATGEVVQRVDFDEFGQIISSTGLGFQSLGFSGGIHDVSTGLVRLGARDYDPTIGRWVNKDPIRFAGGDENLYGYAGGDPINHVDPTGEGVGLCAAMVAVCTSWAAYSATSTVQAFVEMENRILELRRQEAILRDEVDAILEGKTCPGMAEDPVAELRRLQQEELNLEREYMKEYTNFVPIGYIAGIACDAVVLAACLAPTP